MLKVLGYTEALPEIPAIFMKQDDETYKLFFTFATALSIKLEIFLAKKRKRWKVKAAFSDFKAWLEEWPDNCASFLSSSLTFTTLPVP